MDHAHETALWKAIADLEHEVGKRSSRRPSFWTGPAIALAFALGCTFSYSRGIDSGFAIEDRIKTRLLQSQESIGEREVRLPPAFPPTSDHCTRGGI